MKFDPKHGSRVWMVVALPLAIGALLAHRLGAQSAKLTITGTPALHITTATAGSPPTSAVDATPNYSVRANGAMKLVAHLSTGMPAGVTLTVTLTPVTGSVAVGPINLTTVDQTVLTNITTTTTLTGAMSYSLSATSAAGVIPNATNTVTFTLTAYP